MLSTRLFRSWAASPAVFPRRYWGTSGASGYRYSGATILASSGALLVGVPEGAVGEDGAGVGGGVGCVGVSGIEFSQFEGEIIRQLGDLLKRETDATLKQVGVMRQGSE